MSAAELLIFVLCLFVGYWLVSRLLDRSASGKREREQQGEYLPREPHIDARATLSNWFLILGVRETAGKPEIEAAYKRRMALYPDSALAMMVPERRAAAEDNVRQIKAAYELGMRLFRG
jgi:DnaJ-domain-containing protein 1